MCGGGACTTEIMNSWKGCANPVQSWVGCVVQLGENNWHDDSDFYALVWDEESQTVKRIDYATTRCWTYHNGAKVDADETTMAKAKAYQAEQHRLAKIEIAKIESTTPMVGKEVRSLTTRGKNVGIVGLVRRVQPDQYRRSQWAPDVAAIEVAGEPKLRYLPVNRIEVINPEQYLITS
jgi:hypothetical protein